MSTGMDVLPLLPSFRQGCWITAVGSLIYALARVIHNVFFHPLSRFPGPPGAACTKLWLAYMIFVRRVSLPTLREELHQKYGDIIRIAPNELHFAKPTAYDEIYNSQNKWDKDYKFYRSFNTDEAFFTQTEYLESKHRRALFSNMFSRRAISDIQHLIRDQLDRFCDLLKEQNAAGKSSNLYLGFQCFAADVITNFLFATCFDQLSFPDFQGDIVKGVDMSLPVITLGMFSAVFTWVVYYFPPSILMLLAPSLKGLVVFRRALESQVKKVLQNPELLDDAPHRVIYNELLNPETNKGLPPPTVSRLCHDAQTLFAAGSHTTGTTLMTGTFYVLRNPEAQQRLVDELHTVWPVLDQAPSYEQLEKLPFLVNAFICQIYEFALRMEQTAVIKEALRISTAVPAGLPRIVPHLQTIVSQSPLFLSFSEEIFARPHEFLPDRWLQPESKSLENYLVVFSKGPRSCLGINLAYWELYLAFAYLFRRFDLREDSNK
ncbi:putative cytochrome P450 [Russula aff. rugulosa BPL654]|nr:putative cytochrome P450 [Russula aff. rugulosa BPL654]